MKLAALLETIPEVQTTGKLPDSIQALEYDSRRVAPDSLFIALRGAKVDGHKFAAQAAQRGAVAVVAEEPLDLPESCALLRVPDSRAAMADLAAVFYGQPARQLKLLGVTGTNGKTSVAFLLRHILAAVGNRCGMIGTVEYDLGERVVPASRTTPESLELQAYLAAMRDAGCGMVVMEVSSHALQQHRVRGLDFSVGGFTNLTQDHLDYHGDMEQYFAAKRRLFTDHKSGTAVVNAADPYGQRLANEFAAQTVGDSPTADLFIEIVKLAQAQSLFRIDGVEFSMPLIGRHNVANAALALGMVRALGVTLEDCVKPLASATPVPGRLEPILEGQPFAVYVDYAHTDDALRQVLSTLREITPGQLRVVFGCGGNRDAGKRQKMGAVAATVADAVMITTDNPRREDPAAIAEQIAVGCASVDGADWQIELDRERAFDETLRAAISGDTVLLAGKGHETYQEINDLVQPFDDRAMARSILQTLKEAR